MTEQLYLMAIDAGTGSVRAIIFNEEGKELGIGQKEWVHLPEEGVPGAMSFDTKYNWQLILTCIKIAIQKADIDPKKIAAISATSMREALVAYDVSGNEIWACANVDSRASKEVEYLRRNYPNLEKKSYYISGQTYALAATPRLLWLKNNRGNIYEKIVRVHMLSDWIIYKLSGEIVSEPSNAGTSGIFSLKDRQWSGEILNDAQLKEHIIPISVEPGTVIGYLLPEVAQETAINPKAKIVMGGGDVQLGCIGTSVIHKNEAAIFGGSFWQTIVNMDTPNVDPQMNIRINPHAVPQLWQAEAISFFTGLAMRWFRDGFCQEEVLKAKELHQDAYRLLEEQATKVPVGSNGVMALFSDAMRYQKWYHGSPTFTGLSIDPKQCNKYVLFRALEENAAIVAAENLSLILSFYPADLTEITFASGAAKGVLWPQIVADVLGLKVKIPKVKEASSLGAAILAGVGFGVWNNVSEGANELVEIEKIISPNYAHFQQYAELRQKWRHIYQHHLKLVDDTTLTPMWSAPGNQI